MKKTILVLAATMMAAIASAQNAERMIAVSALNIHDEDFERVAKECAAFGATHLDCSQVEPSMWQWNMDRNDPYPCWSMHRPTLFKFVVPDKVAPYVPADYADRNYQNLKKRGAVLKKYHLKGFMWTMDPAFLPEQAYRDHPNWRGPRCDQARRARHEYYAPCIDDEEFRTMFTESVTKLCKAAPIEFVHILCNDSGAGLCWYPHLYPGPNGPAHCLTERTVGDRALLFLDMWQEGAAKAGLTGMRVNLSHTNDVENVLPRLKKGQFINNRTSEGGAGFNMISFDNANGEHFSPVLAMPRMVTVARHLQAAQKNTNPILIGLRGPDEVDLYRFMRMYLHTPVGDGALNRYKALQEVAATFVGAGHATELVQVWDDIDASADVIDIFQTGGRIFQLGTLHQRWLVRPFVPFPEELEGDDLHYWRDFIFQAQTEKEAMDMTDMQAHKWLGGYGGTFLVSKSMNKVLPLLAEARKICSKLEGCALDKESADYLKALTMKIRLAACFCRNAANAVEFQWFMDTREDTKSDKDDIAKISYQGDPELVRVNQLVRDEIDNCYDVIKVLDDAGAAGLQIMVQAPSSDFEQIMYYGPDVQDKLRKKIRIMEDHRRDFLRIWRSMNK